LKNCVFTEYDGSGAESIIKGSVRSEGHYMTANAHLPIIAFADRTNKTPVYLHKKDIEPHYKKGIEPHNYHVYYNVLLIP
jgi:hypothetical protein